MKYLIILLAVATVMLLVGLGVRMHSDWKYTNKMFYHTTASQLYEFEEVFAERKLGDAIEFWSIMGETAGGVWFVVLKLSRDRKGRKTT